MELSARDGRRALALAAALALLYWRCHCRTFGPGDSPQHVLSALTWGVSRPPGYPLYTALAHLLSFGSAGLVNALSGFLHAAAGALFFLLLRRLGCGAAAAACASALLCLSPLYWYYSEVAEVRALNDLLALGSAYLAASLSDRPSRAALLAFGACVGLGVSHHPTFVLVLPALAWLLFSKKTAPESLAIAAPAAVCACAAPYLFLWLRLHFGAAPVYNPDGVRTAKDVLDLFLRKNTGGALSFASGLPGLAEQKLELSRGWRELGWFWGLTLHDLTIPGLLLSILGVWRLLKRDRSALVFWLAWTIASLLPIVFLVSQEVRFGDADYLRAMVLRFYLLPLIGLFALAAFGMDAMLGNSRRIFGWALLSAVCAGALLFRPIDLGRADPVRAYVGDIVRSSGPRDILFVQSDEANFSLTYLDLVERSLDERVVLNPALFHNASYIDALRRRHPSLKLPLEGGVLSLSVSRWMKENPDRAFLAEPTWRDRLIQISSACYPQGILLRVGDKFPPIAETVARARDFLDHSAAEQVPSWGLRPWTQEVYLLKAYAMQLEFYGSFTRRAPDAALEERRRRAFAAVMAVR